MRLKLVTALSFLFAIAAFGADEPAVAIHSKHVLDVRTGTEGEAWVVVRGDRIASIDKSAPKGAHVIELGNATLLPGLIDCHVHLEADWNDLSATGNLRHSSAEKTLVGMLNAQTYLQHGTGRGDDRSRLRHDRAAQRLRARRLRRSARHRRGHPHLRHRRPCGPKRARAGRADGEAPEHRRYG